MTIENIPQAEADNDNDFQYEKFVRNIETFLSTMDTSPVLVKDDSKGTLYNLCFNDYYRRLFYEDLKIVGGAFSVLEEVSRQALLLFRQDYNNSLDVKDSDFFWFPYEWGHFDKDVAIGIDRLFLTTRESQKFDYNAPDFLRFINRPEYELSCFTNNIFKHHSLPVLFCDNSEIVIFLLCYLELLERSSIIGQSQLPWPETSPEVVSILDNEDTVVRIYNTYSNPELNSILLSPRLYRDLGLFDGEDSPTSLFERLKERLEQCGVAGSTFGVSEESTYYQSLRATVSNLVDRYFQPRIKADKGTPSYYAGLRTIHQLARFPIIPYLEILLRRKKWGSIGHLVFPVWKSFSFAPEVTIEDEKRKEYNVVFALLTVDDGLYGQQPFGSAFDRLSRFIRRLGQITADTVFYKKLAHKRVQQQATRAAISQVLARNISHNVGSHVSYKATNIAIKNRIAKLYKHRFAGSGSAAVREINRQETVIDWIDFMSEKLDTYEIHRNEYLADFNLSPQSFRFYHDAILPFCENTLILDNLASAEGAHYATARDNQLKIRVFIKPEGGDCYAEIKAEYPALTCDFPEAECDRPIIYPDHFPYLLKNRSERSSLADGINSKRLVGTTDVDVLMHSEQGLYSILENFIRNSAKHNRDALASSPLEVKIYLEEKDDRFNVIICDNVSKLEPAKLFNSSHDSPGLYQRIKTGIVGDLEQSVRQNLGFADMNINSFLFKFKASDVSNEALPSNFHLVILDGDECNLAAQKVDGSFTGDSGPTSKHPFGFMMEFLKPRKVLWIGDDVSAGEHGGRISGMKKSGVVRYDKLTDFINKGGKQREEIAAFDFAVFNKSFNYEHYLQHQVRLPPRVLVIPEAGQERYDKPNVRTVDASYGCDAETADNLVEMCWGEWLGRLPNAVTAYIYYEENLEETASALETMGELQGRHTVRSVKSLRSPVIITNDVTSVIYDHHGGAFRGGNLDLESAPDGNSVINFYTNHSKIVFDKRSDDYGRLIQPLGDDHRKALFAYTLIDAATTNVFILDERIAILANNNYADEKIDNTEGVKFRDYDRLTFSRFCYGKVFPLNFISTDDGAGKPIHFGQLQYRLTLHAGEGTVRVSADEAAGKVLSEIDAVRKDILVIHRTYMKRDVLGMEVKDFLDLAGTIFGSVVVTSGGGYPHSIKEPVRFIPFSVIQQCLGARLAKLKLVSFLQRLHYVG